MIDLGSEKSKEKIKYDKLSAQIERDNKKYSKILDENSLIIWNSEVEKIKGLVSTYEQLVVELERISKKSSNAISFFTKKTDSKIAVNYNNETLLKNDEVDKYKLHSKINQLVLLLENKIEEKEQLEKDIMFQKEQKKVCELQIKEKEQIIAQFEKDKKKSQKINSELKDEYTKSERRIGELEANLKALEIEAQIEKAEISSEKTSSPLNLKLQKENITKKENVVEHNDYEEVVNLNAQLNQEIQHLIRDKMSLVDEKDKLNKIIEELNIKLEKQSTSYKLDIENYMLQINELKKDYRCLNQERIDSENIFSIDGKVVNNMSDEINHLNEQIANLRKINEASNSQNMKLQANVEKLQKQNTELVAKEQGNLINKSQQKSEHDTKLYDENSILREKLSDVRRELNELKWEQDEKRNSKLYEKCQKDLEKEKSKFHELKTERNRLTAENSNLKREIYNLKFAKSNVPSFTTMNSEETQLSKSYIKQLEEKDSLITLYKRKEYDYKSKLEYLSKKVEELENPQNEDGNKIEIEPAFSKYPNQKMNDFVDSLSVEYDHTFDDQELLAIELLFGKKMGIDELKKQLLEKNELLDAFISDVNGSFEADVDVDLIIYENGYYILNPELV